MPMQGFTRTRRHVLTWGAGIAASLAGVVWSIYALSETIRIMGRAATSSNALLVLPLVASGISVAATTGEYAGAAWACAGAMWTIVILWLWSAGPLFVWAALACTIAACLASVSTRRRHRLWLIPIYLILGGAVIAAVHSIYLDSEYAHTTRDTRWLVHVYGSWVFLIVITAVAVAQVSRQARVSSVQRQG